MRVLKNPCSDLKNGHIVTSHMAQRAVSLVVGGSCSIVVVGSS